MSYKLDRIMSLGSSPKVAQALKSLNVREPGPVDWARNTNKMTSVIQLFTGDLFKSILKRNFYSRTYEECIRYQCPGAEEFIWDYECLDNYADYKKIVSRFCRLEEHIRKNGKFIYLTTEHDDYKSVDTFFYLIETMVPYFNKSNILILCDTTISLPSYTNSKYVTIDRESTNNNYWENLIKSNIPLDWLLGDNNGIQ